jgi:hypothetical protein
MTFRYKDIAGEFSKYQKKANIDCRVQFGCTLEELLDKDELTQEESAFIQWYKRNSPVSLGDCTPNKIARTVERSLKSITNSWREAGDVFNYGIYRTANRSGNTEAYLKIAKIITWYENVLKEMPGFIKANKLNDAAIAEYRAAIANEVMVECYCNCSSADELASIVLDLTYGGNHNYQIAWDICGDVIIRNLLKTNNYQISYYTQAEDGELEYKGARYAHHYAEITEEELNDCIK